MNKPIVAHSFEEMNKLDTELVNYIPLQKRKAAWKAITELFADSTSCVHLTKNLFIDDAEITNITQRSSNSWGN